MKFDLFSAAAAQVARYDVRSKAEIRRELLAPEPGDWYCLDGGKIGPDPLGVCPVCHK
jgi:hypothetical protein